MTIELRDFIREERIVFIKEKKKTNALRRLIEKAADLSLVRDRIEFETDVLQREAMASTGIGLGIAIPHGRCRSVDDFFIITGLAGRPIDWQAIDHAPVQVVFLLGVPENRPSAGDISERYLDLIGALMLLVKDTRRRQRLFAASTPQEMITALSGQTGSFTAKT